jgi:hypothetical protein
MLAADAFRDDTQEEKNWEYREWGRADQLKEGSRIAGLAAEEDVY